MAKKEKITIVGAGLSGMVSSILLSGKGYRVEVLEQHESIGCQEGMNPSLHVTPMDVRFLSEQIGLDLTGVVKPLTSLNGAIGERIYRFNKTPLYVIERGSRPSSIDMFLYNEALRRGVVFHFRRRVKDFSSIAKGSIIACGLNEPSYRKLNREFIKVYGFYASRQIEREDVSFIYFDDYSTDYFYGLVANGIFYCLLFSRKTVTKEMFRKAKRQLEEREGISGLEWKEFRAAVPVKGFSSPGLFWKDKILAGTISGSIDPLFGFGIVGSILSGKIAADAVQDRTLAMDEFERLNRYYPFSFFIRMVLSLFPLRNLIFRQIIQRAYLSRFVLSWMACGVPSVSKEWLFETVRFSERRN